MITDMSTKSGAEHFHWYYYWIQWNSIGIPLDAIFDLGGSCVAWSRLVGADWSMLKTG